MTGSVSGEAGWNDGPMSAQETIQAIAAPTGAIGAAFYFHPDTVAAGKELGLDGFRFYVLGRGGALGDVSAGVVKSAFGYFDQGIVDKMWNTAKTTVEPRAAAQAYWDECGRRGRELLADLDPDLLTAYCDAADAVIAAQSRGGLPLFAATAELDCADDAPARAMQKAATLRELRGSAHLCCILASGLTEAEAHCHKRPDMIQGFGYAEPPVMPADIDERLAAAEAATDRALEPAFSTLSDEQSAALVAGTTAMAGALGI